MHVAVVDDSPEALRQIETALREYATTNREEIEIHTFSSGERLLSHYRPFLYAVIFLDVFMEGLSGIQTAAKIRAVDDTTFLVFLTVSDGQQADAIHWHAYDYIFKSDGPKAVWNVMDRILRTRTRMERERLSFSCDRKAVALPYADIVSLQADRNYLLIKDKTGGQYRPRMTFSSVSEKLLRDDQFFEITRGVIVNLNYAAGFTESECILKDGSHLPVSMRNGKTIAQIWRNYLFMKTRNQT